MAVQPQDDVLFQMIRTGQAWHGRLPVQPDKTVQVRVLNGTGRPGWRPGRRPGCGSWAST